MTPPHPYDEKETWGYRMKLMTINPAAENDGLWHTTDVMNVKNEKRRKKRDGRQTVTHDTDVTLTDTERKRATITPARFLHRHTCGVCGRKMTHRTANSDKRTDSLASDSGRNSHVHLYTQYGHPLDNVLLHTAGGYSEHLRDLFVGEVFDIAFLQDKLCARRQCLHYLLNLVITSFAFFPFVLAVFHKQPVYAFLYVSTMPWLWYVFYALVSCASKQIGRYPYLFHLLSVSPYVTKTFAHYIPWHFIILNNMQHIIVQSLMKSWKDILKLRFYQFVIHIPYFCAQK